MDSAEERLPISLIVGLVMTGFAMMSWLVWWLTGKATSATTVGMLMLGMCLLMVSTWTGPSGVAANCTLWQAFPPPKPRNQRGRFRPENAP